SGEYSRLKGCPVSLDHYTTVARRKQVGNVATVSNAKYQTKAIGLFGDQAAQGARPETIDQ
ncbi:hypothetical protein ACW9I8_29610, partial [Pseudomonas reactans]